jgi:hypothetical protein
MKKFRLVLTVLVLFASLPGVALADCDDDCDGPFQTCLNICRQTNKPDSPGGSKCVDHCFHGLAGCQKKCEANKKKKSENTTNCTKEILAAADVFEARDGNIVLAANCIDQGLTCVLNGTPCCAPYSCKGKFPITTCQ